MRRLSNLSIGFAICVQLFGCDSAPSEAEADRLALRADVDALKSEIGTIKGERALEKIWDGIEKIAFLTPGSDGYSAIAFDLGVLTVQLVDVKPYASGSKITLKFGNVLSASVNGLKAKIDWGKVNENGTALNETTKSKEVTFTETLRHGSWTAVSVVLDGIPPNELGFVRVSGLQHTGIQLTR